MADKTISELPAAPSALSDYDGNELFVLEQSATAKKLRMQILESWLVSIADGHGGIQSITKTGSAGTDPVVDTYTIIYADETSSTFTVTNGAKGEQGEKTYVWVAYAAEEPVSDADISLIPDKWIGIYVGLEDTFANLHYTDFDWYLFKGPQGDTGVGIGEVTYTSSSGLTDTYTVWSDETTPRALGTLMVTNGSGGVSTVNGVAPDGSGNVQLTPPDIGAPKVPLYLTATLTTLPATISDSGITPAMRVIECVFSVPSAITSDVTWTTSAGSIVLSGTISGTTNVGLVLIETT